MSWDYPSYDIDDYENDTDDAYTSKTVFNNDGTVDRFDSLDGKWDNGHTHDKYDSSTDYYKGDSRSYRTREESEGRRWKNKYYALECLGELSFGELQMVEALSTNSYVKQTARHLMSSKCSLDFVFEKGRSLCKEYVR